MYYADHEDPLVEAPQLAILEALDTLLDRATALIVVRHPEIQDVDSFAGLPPEVWVADTLASTMRSLQRLILQYREAAIDDAHHRHRQLVRQTITQPAPAEPDF